MGKRTVVKPQMSDAAEILRHRYNGEDPEPKASIEAERVNASVAQRIYDRRTAARLAQKEVAEPIGTIPSVVSWLGSADCEGHSLSL